VRLDHLLSRERELELAVGTSAKDPPRLIVTIVSVVPAGWGAADARLKNLSFEIATTQHQTPNRSRKMRASSHELTRISRISCHSSSVGVQPPRGSELLGDAGGAPGRLAQLVRALP
jgi:hypothetical protein